ncbi:Amino acid transporter [Macleaya cordata]|uniref:Amino acid transporter n=1 Tax=Macleaya cordata TaxID=56857 RepID=A0A200QDG5_MACCD|nr:Amino acid transporter [Macleaya cordata]
MYRSKTSFSHIKLDHRNIDDAPDADVAWGPYHDIKDSPKHFWKGKMGGSHRTVWTASAHIITAVIGSGVLSLPWCIAQLGWIAGPIALLVFSVITFFTSSLLADCYRSPDPVTGKRNYTYMEAVGANLGERMRKICGFTQYGSIVGYAIGYAVTAAVSMVAIYKSTCFSKRGYGAASCNISSIPFIVLFGIAEIVLSQIPNFHKLSMLSTIAAIMSFCYASIGVALSLTKVILGNTGRATVGGVEVGPNLSVAQKTWKMFSAIGDIEMAYSFTFILIEIQDTIRAPAENKQMKKANLVGVTTTSVFYILSGCIGYAAFGNEAPGNLLSGVHDPLWLVNFANVCIVVHIVCAYQKQILLTNLTVSSVESWSAKRWQTSKFITHEYLILLGININLFRLLWRSLFVVLATLFAMAIPFFNDILALLGAIGYSPLTVYFPISMYIARRKIKRLTFRWVGLQTLNLFCLICAVAAACGSIQGIIKALSVNPFS